jgi:hypothetical protein
MGTERREIFFFRREGKMRGGVPQETRLPQSWFLEKRENREKVLNKTGKIEKREAQGGRGIRGEERREERGEERGIRG